MGRMITGALDLYGALFALLVLLITGGAPRADRASRVTRINRVMLTFIFVLLTADGAALCFFQDVKTVYSLLLTVSCFCFYSIVGGYLIFVLEALSIPKNKKTKALILINLFVCLLGFIYWLFNNFTSFIYTT